MVTRESIYAGALRVRGFHEWEAEGSPEDLRKCLPAGSVPAFLYVRFFDLTITFVLDEHAVVWAAEEAVDLSDFGFNELAFEDPDRPPLLN